MSEPERITVRMYEVKKYFNVSPNTVRNWKKAGLIEIHRRGRISSVRVKDMLDVLSEKSSDS